MPRYEFKLIGGEEVIEEFFPMSKAPDFGTIIERCGKKYIRIISGGAEVRDNTNTTKYPCEDISLPRGTDIGNGTGPKGFPVFNSQREHKEFGRRHGFAWD